MAKNVNWRHLTLELFVVFLGVTSGFILNNWRGNVKEQKQEIQYLEGFREDVKDNIITLEESIEMDSLWMKRAAPQINSLREKQFSIDSTETVINLMSTFSKLSSKTGTWKDITNSGNLNLIKDFQLKRQIVNYHMSIETVDFIDDYLFDFFDRTLSSFIMTQFSFVDAHALNPEIANTLEFSNVFFVYSALLQQRYSAYQDLLQESDSLLLVLENKLSY